MRADRDMQPWLYEGDGDDLAIPPPGFKSAFPRDWQRNIMNITTPEHWSPYPSPFKKFEPSSSKREICFSEHEHQEESLASFNDDVGLNIDQIPVPSNFVAGMWLPIAEDKHLCLSAPFQTITPPASQLRSRVCFRNLYFCTSFASHRKQRILNQISATTGSFGNLAGLSKLW